MLLGLISVKGFDLAILCWKFDDKQNEGGTLQITLFGWNHASFLILFNLLVDPSSFFWLCVFLFNRRHWRLSRRFESWEIPQKFRRGRGRFNNLRCLFLTTFFNMWIGFLEIIRFSNTFFILITIWTQFWWLLLPKE